MRRGKIKVNNKKIKSSYKLQKNDQIILYNIAFSTHKKNIRRTPYKATKKDLSYSSNIFIENNEDFVVINKPAGIAVQSGTKSRKNIIDILRKTKEFEVIHAGLVYRRTEQRYPLRRCFPFSPSGSPRSIQGVVLVRPRADYRRRCLFSL